MQRKDGWEAKLNTGLQEHTYAPYVLGETDCFAATTGIVSDMTDTDILKKWRGKYKSFLEAARFIQAEGGVLPWLDNQTNGRIAPKKAQRGDIVARHIDRVVPSLGLCAGNQALLFTHDKGAVYVPMMLIEAAWRV